MLGSRPGGQQHQPNQQYQPTQQPAPVGDSFDDDIPF